MKTHTNLVQNSPEWHAHRASHFNASDAPAMMGCSPYKTRTQLLHELKTGIKPEVDAAAQRRFDEGHRFEALARPLAEDRIGEELYPVTGSEGKFSASFDGLTMMEDIAFEHKTLNAELLEALKGGNCQGWGLPMQYQVQMEHQLMVSGAEKCLFMASKWQGDTLLDVQHCWYVPNEALREQIIAGWEQFEKDLAAYVPTEAVQAAVGRTPDTLPALHIEVTGMVTASNMAEFKETAIAAIKSVNRDLKTDQDFADNAKAIKWCSDIESRVKAAKEHALGQTASIDALFRTMDEISAEARSTRLELEKLDTAKKLQVKTDIVQKAKDEFALHIKQLNAGLGGFYLGGMGANFADVIKGKKTVDSMQNAVDTEMARVKVEANTSAEKIAANIKEINGLIVGLETLFPDYLALVLKDSADMVAVVKNRITEHKAKEEKRLEAERENIRIEEHAKLVKEAEDAAALAAVPAIVAPVVGKTAALKAVKAEPAPNDNFNTLTALLWRLTDAENAQILEYVRANYAQRLAA